MKNPELNKEQVEELIEKLTIEPLLGGCTCQRDILIGDVLEKMVRFKGNGFSGTTPELRSVLVEIWLHCDLRKSLQEIVEGGWEEYRKYDINPGVIGICGNTAQPAYSMEIRLRHEVNELFYFLRGLFYEG